MILCDSGPLIAVAVRDDAHYNECTTLFTGLRLAGHRLLVPATVVAEVGYMLEQRVGPTVEAAFLQAVAEGAFELVNLDPEDLARMAWLVGRYDDLPLGTTDASVIALAERLGVSEVATLDQRHFRVVRPSHVDALTLLPEVR
ncbi:PIN domain-containing protein [Micropruina sp.]|uniref:type II toxin-antitoxin system VapC family toxin n=1 Tax=Micropruina sp. TaxID=2737536 RepID=UPI00262CF1D8|nr:PIN domain-containing protein [Micropruina sp.]